MKLILKICVLFLGVSFLSCSGDNSEQISVEKANAEVLELIRRGYSLEELGIRAKCPSEMLYTFLNKGSLPQEYCQIVDSIYLLDKRGKLISASKTGFTAKECIQKIFVKAQNLPIASQFTGVSVVSICNELTNKQPLTKDDSLKIMVAYIDNLYGYAQIPTNVDVKPYFKDYYNENRISNVDLPMDYSARFKNATAEQRAILKEFVDQAEQFELEANKNLEYRINQRIDNFIEKVTERYIDNECNSIINTFKCCFKSDEEKRDYYLGRLEGQINDANLDSLIRTEIVCYCISVNCSRELAVNELLGYKENRDNMDIASKATLSGLIKSFKNINYTGSEYADNLISSASVVINLAAFFVTKNPANLRGVAKVGLNLASFVKNSFSKEVNEEKLVNKNEKLSNSLRTLFRHGINEGLNEGKEDYYKKALDENTKLFYEKLRDDFKLK